MTSPGVHQQHGPPAQHRMADQSQQAAAPFLLEGGVSAPQLQVGCRTTVPNSNVAQHLQPQQILCLDYNKLKHNSAALLHIEHVIIIR